MTAKRTRKRPRPTQAQQRRERQPGRILPGCRFDDVIREAFRGVRSSWGVRVPAGRR
jgi:hypothetical protein